MPAIRQARYELVSDLNSVSRLLPLKKLIWAYGRYHAKPTEVPTADGLAQSGYRALVYEELTERDESWRIALLFRIGREKKSVWHTVVSIDYVLIDPSARITFTKLSSCVRLLSQFSLKHLKASCIDILINLENQSNPALKKYLQRAFINEGMTVSNDGSSCAKRLRDVDDDGKNTVNLPLPNVVKSEVKGLRPAVQSTIKSQNTKDGERVIFVGRIPKGSKNHKLILSFCKKHDGWMNPKLSDRTSYMQTTFTGEGNVNAYVESLVQDAHFIIVLDADKRMTGFMAFIAGYSMSSISNMQKGGFSNPSKYVSPERVIYVPAIVCDSRFGGLWTKKGLQQAVSLWKMLFTIVSDKKNRNEYELIGSIVGKDSVHAHLLEALGFTCKSTMSNLPWHARASSIYARHT